MSVFVWLKTVHVCGEWKIEGMLKREVDAKYPIFLVLWKQQKVCMPDVMRVCEKKFWVLTHFRGIGGEIEKVVAR